VRIPSGFEAETANPDAPTKEELESQGFTALQVTLLTDFYGANYFLLVDEQGNRWWLALRTD
jgi:uncharacterized glyoxalase superfamily protein PhnB